MLRHFCAAWVLLYLICLCRLNANDLDNDINRQKKQRRSSKLELELELEFRAKMEQNRNRNLAWDCNWDCVVGIVNLTAFEGGFVRIAPQSSWVPLSPAPFPILPFSTADLALFLVNVLKINAP